MTKKKRGHPDAEEILARPWCYYCERDFDDLKILISHQKAKHFKCERCGRRLNTAGGLSVHMTQVHKENLESVENALPNRSGLNVEIFGMEGIPEDIVQQHNQRVLTQFHQAEADRRATTGNPAPGAAGPGGPKKPKVEEAGDLKARLAAFKAKKAAAAAGVSSGNGTPTGAGQASPGSATPQSPGPLQPGMSGYAPPQFPPQGSPPQASFQQSFGQQGYGMPPQQPPFPQSQSPFNQGPPGYGAPPQQGPPGMSQFQPYPQPPSFATSPPPGMFQQNHHQAPQTSQNGSFPRLTGLPAPPGLPQRPAFGAPTVNPSQMQQMHHGQHPGQSSVPNAANQDPRVRPHEFAQQQPTATEADVDDLIANVARESNAAQTEEKAAAAAAATAEATAEATAGKKSKKDKDKDRATKMVYEDNEVSPEEKMAKLSRYAFDPSDSKPETVLGEAGEAAVTGPVVGENDVLDAQG